MSLPLTPGAGWIRTPPAPCRGGQLGPNHLERALGEGPVLNLDSQGHFPADVEVGPGFGLGVAHLVVGLQQQRRGQQAGRHTVPAVVGSVEFGEITVPEQLAPQRCQQAVKGVSSHVVQVQSVCFPEAPLIRSLSQHCYASLCLMSPSMAAPRLRPLSGQIPSIGLDHPTRLALRVAQNPGSRSLLCATITLIAQCHRSFGVPRFRTRFTVASNALL